MIIKTFTNHDKFIKESEKLILDICKKSGKVHIALSGGSTPIPLYKALARNKKIPFDKIHFYQVDERYVPKSHKDSNQKMIYENLIKPREKEANWHYFDTSLPIQKSLKKYSKEIKNITFDLTIVGIGPDGHTASLFPNTKALNSKSQTAHTQTKNFQIKDRLTLTFPKILKSKKILILLKGKDKSPIIQELKNPTKTISQFPAKKLTSHKNLQIHFNS